jgi:hypothetical protein
MTRTICIFLLVIAVALVSGLGDWLRERAGASAKGSGDSGKGGL